MSRINLEEENVEHIIGGAIRTHSKTLDVARKAIVEDQSLFHT